MMALTFEHGVLSLLNQQAFEAIGKQFTRGKNMTAPNPVERQFIEFETKIVLDIAAILGWQRWPTTVEVFVAGGVGAVIVAEIMPGEVDFALDRAESLLREALLSHPGKRSS